MTRSGDQSRRTAAKSRKGGGNGLGGVVRSTDRAQITNGHIGPLTARQKQVLALYEKGMSRKEIAVQLGVKRIDSTLDMALLKSGR